MAAVWRGSSYRFCDIVPSVQYVARYVEGFGNELRGVIADIFYVIPPWPFSEDAYGWQLTLNDKNISDSMSTTLVKSNDQITWLYQQLN